MDKYESIVRKYEDSVHFTPGVSVCWNTLFSSKRELTLPNFVAELYDIFRITTKKKIEMM